MTRSNDRQDTVDLKVADYDYGRVSGVKTAFAWHFAPLQNPKTLVAHSIMPNFNFTSRQAQSLALLVMSWEREQFAMRYVPGATPVDRPIEEEVALEKRMLEGEGAFFVKKGCFICYSVDALGIENSAKIGPDLSEAMTDVQSRFGLSRRHRYTLKREL